MSINLAIPKIYTLQSRDEKMKFASAVSIAYNTMLYWNENLSTWESFFNIDPQRNSSTLARSVAAKSPGKAIGKADIGGIIKGGVTGCVYGAIGGTATVPGVGTLTGCAALGVGGAVVGGIGDSAKAAVDAFIDWLTD